MPVAEYPHGHGCAVAGVGVYRGDDIPFLEGFFLAVDYCTGKILSLSHDSVGKWQFQEFRLTLPALAWRRCERRWGSLCALPVIAGFA
ncbi:MAG: hypothetical protein R2855_13500 [Thermomicrobiales bacterium]